MSRIDLQGRTFGRLTVLRLSEKRGHNRSRLWRCRCACGNITYTSTEKLLKGKKKSCGCGARVKAALPQQEFSPKTDCAYYRRDLNGGCLTLTEMLCVTRGWCTFYRRRDEAAEG